MPVQLSFRHLSNRQVADMVEVAEAELLFVGEDMGMLAGMKLVGFRVWCNPEGQHFVTLPSRAFGTFESGGRRYFDFLRAQDGTAALVRRLKRWIQSEYLTFTKEPRA